MQGPEVLIPITIFAGGFAMIFGIFYLKTRENLAMLEKGFNPKQHAHRPAPFRSLKTGLLLLGAGIGLLLAYIIERIIESNMARHARSDNDNPALYFSLIAIGGGIGLIMSYSMERKYLMQKKED